MLLFIVIIGMEQQQIEFSRPGIPHHSLTQNINPYYPNAAQQQQQQQGYGTNYYDSR